VTIRTESLYNLKKMYKVNKIWQNNVIPWNFPLLFPLTPSVHNCAEVGGQETIVDEEKVKKNKMKGQGKKRAEK
jgi:hypothetical protein